jgi:hypothetical protein
MNHKPDEKLKDSRSAGEHRGRPNLRLIRGEQAEDEAIQPARTAREGRRNQAPQHRWDDDDDPGPTAA